MHASLSYKTLLAAPFVLFFATIIVIIREHTANNVYSPTSKAAIIILAINSIFLVASISAIIIKYPKQTKILSNFIKDKKLLFLITMTVAIYIILKYSIKYLS